VAAQGALVPDDNVIEALAPEGADHAFNERILPGRTRRGQHFCVRVPEILITSFPEILITFLPERLAG
jgi:hypothetical protein